MPKLHSVANNIRRQIVIIVVTIVLTGFTIPVLFSLLIPSLILRLIVGTIARKFRPDLAGFVYGKRAMMALESTNKKPKSTILLHFVLDGSLTPDKIRLAFQQKIVNYCDNSGNLKYLHLQQTFTQFSGFLFWKWDRNFNLSHHIRDYDYHDENLVLPDICNEVDLQRVTPGLISKPFKEGTSPWEMLVISNYRAASNTTGKRQIVLVCRVHHALADGYSVLKLMFKAFGLEGAAVPRPNFQKVSFLRRIWMTLGMPFRLPYDLATQFVDGFDWSNSWHLLNKKYSRNYHAFFSDQIPVDQIKEIKNKYDTNYNAAAYAVAIGGIRRLMIEAGQEVPRSMSCMAPFPLPHHPGGLVVHVSKFSFSFSPRIECPMERIRNISKSIRLVNDAPALPIAFNWGLNLWGVLPVFITKLIYNKPIVTLALTSFPGPQCELTTMGTAKLVDIIPALGHPAGNLGAMGVLVSMAGKQRFVLTVDQVIFDSYHVPVNFARHINDEIHDLLYSEGQNLKVV